MRASSYAQAALYLTCRAGMIKEQMNVGRLRYHADALCGAWISRFGG